MVEGVWNKFGAFVHQQIIWAKDRPILTRSWYSWQHEPCFFGWVRPNKPDRIADDFLPSVWQIPTVPVGQPTEHPTSKPVELFAIPMRQHTRRGDVCYEPFCGSGSQLIAAEKLGRRCYALEISPRYCDVIVRRWIHFVGEDNAPSRLVERYCVATETEVTA
jgi:DNA modification methylase